MTGQISVNRLLELVKKASETAQSGIQNSELPALTAVELTLETSLKIGGGAEGELLVLTASWKPEQTTTQTLSIKLSRPKPKQEAAVTGFAPNVEARIYEELVKAIIAASKGAKAAYESMLPGFDLNSITSTVALEVTDDKELGIKFKILSWLSADVSGSKTKTGQHKIALEFEKTAP